MVGGSFRNKTSAQIGKSGLNFDVCAFIFISGLAGSIEVAHEARAASGEPGKAEDCGWRGSSEGKSLNYYSNNSYSSVPLMHHGFVSLQRT